MANVLKTRELASLAEELAAMVEARLPLGSGLAEASKRLGPGAAQTLHDLVARIDSGEPVESAVKGTKELPPEFQALAISALNSGGGSESVLEDYAVHARKMIALKQELTRSSVMLLILTVLGYALFVCCFQWISPQYHAFLKDVEMRRPVWLDWSEWLHNTLPVWSWVVPVVVLGLFLIVWKWQPADGFGLGIWARLPFIKKASTSFQLATASGLLARMLSAGITLPYALRMVAGTQSASSFQTALERSAVELERGVPLPDIVKKHSGLPNLWKVLFASQPSPQQLDRGLNMISQVSEAMARDRIDRVRRLGPAVMTVLVGGGVLLIYGTVVLGPVLEILDQLMVPR